MQISPLTYPCTWWNFGSSLLVTAMLIGSHDPVPSESLCITSQGEDPASFFQDSHTTVKWGGGHKPTQVEPLEIEGHLKEKQLFHGHSLWRLVYLDAFGSQVTFMDPSQKNFLKFTTKCTRLPRTQLFLRAVIKIISKCVLL